MASKEEIINFEHIERSLVEEINSFRRNPKSFIPKLQRLIPLFKDNILYLENQAPIITQEGVSAVTEAIESLQEINESLVEIYESEDLTKAARAHTFDIGPRGVASHDGNDGSNVSDRVERFCEWEGALFENLDFANKSGVNVVLAFLIDDGIKSRQHRLNLLDNNIKFFGVSSGHHREYKIVTTVLLAHNIREKNTPYFNAEEELEKLKHKQVDVAPVKEREIRNHYQADDEDAPDETVSVRVTKTSKYHDGKTIRVTKKFYTLEDGRKTIVEVEDHN